MMRRLAIALALVMLSSCATVESLPSPPPPLPPPLITLPPCAPWQAQLVMIGVNVGLVLVAYAGERAFASWREPRLTPQDDGALRESSRTSPDE